MTKNICISGYYGFDNFGDEIILKILVENIKDNNITVFSSNPDKTKKELNVNSIHSFNIKEIIKSIAKCDYLISGGGSLLQDVTSKKSLIYYLCIIALAQFFRKKTIIFAQGLGPINNKNLAKLTSFILKRMNYITVRDNKSIELLKSWGINATKCSDPAWNLETTPQNNGKIGVQLRDFPSLTEEFISQLATNLNSIYKDKEILIYSLQNKLDLEVCNKLKSKLNNAKVIENTSNEALIEGLSNLDTLIAMRFHACLIAIKSGVKLLPINYDIKVEQLAKEFDLNCLSLEYLSLNKEILEKFSQDKIYYDEEKIKNLNFDFKTLLTF